MKIGYYCESPADREALRVFTESLLGQPPEAICMDLDAHSVPAFFNALDGVFRGVHYNSDAEGLIVVVDGDDTEPHEAGHEPANVANCRYCQIQHILSKAKSTLNPRPDRPELKVAVGLAVPAIEAWYLVATKDQIGGERYIPPSGLTASSYRSHLKKLVYGTDRPSLKLETKRAVEAAHRICAQIDNLESAFPVGFGLMAQDIRSWIE